MDVGNAKTWTRCGHDSVTVGRVRRFGILCFREKGQSRDSGKRFQIEESSRLPSGWQASTCRWVDSKCDDNAVPVRGLVWTLVVRAHFGLSQNGLVLVDTLDLRRLIAGAAQIADDPIFRFAM